MPLIPIPPGVPFKPLSPFGPSNPSEPIAPDSPLMPRGPIGPGSPFKSTRSSNNPYFKVEHWILLSLLAFVVPKQLIEALQKLTDWPMGQDLKNSQSVLRNQFEQLNVIVPHSTVCAYAHCFY